MRKIRETHKSEDAKEKWTKLNVVCGRNYQQVKNFQQNLEKLIRYGMFLATLSHEWPLKCKQYTVVDKVG